MNQEKAERVLEIYGTPIIKTKKGTTISFARQDKEDISNIEQLSNKDLVDQWKSLYFIIDIYGQVSLNDMQRMDLLGLEMDNRDMPWLEQELNYWCKHQWELNK